MATRYVRNRLQLAGSLASDYSRPFTQETWEVTHSTLNETEYQVVEAPASGGALTKTLSQYGTISFMGLYNEDTTNFLEVTFYSPRGSLTDTVTYAQAATGDTITDDSSGALYTASGATSYARAGGYVYVTDAATAGNAGPWAIRSATSNVITIVNESTLTADAADAVTLNFLSWHIVRIAPGEFWYCGAVFPTTNMTLLADTAAVLCRIYLGAT